MKKNCVVCGKEFEAKGSVITCSTECRKINQREYDRKRHAANPLKAREYTRKWRAANLEKAREYARKRYVANPEKAKISMCKYHAANPLKAREYTRKWRAANLEKAREINRKYYYKKQSFKLMEAAFGGLSKALNNVQQKEKS